MKRILRVIEYVGSDEFLTACIEQRQVKGTKVCADDCYIREAILGDTAEILKPAGVVETLKKMGVPLAGEGDLAP